MTGSPIIDDGVIGRSVCSIVRTLFSTIFGSKEIRPVCFHADRMVDSLKALVRNSLNAAKNSTFEKVSSPI